MKSIVYWANSNEGFISAIFSFLTILFSAISVWIAIKALKAPYKKKLKIRTQINKVAVLDPDNPFDSSKFEPSLYINVVNTGNKNIALDCLSLKAQYGKLELGLENKDKKTIKPEEKLVIRKDLKYILKDLRHKNIIITTGSLYIIFEDSEGINYRQKVKELKEFLKSPDSYDNYSKTIY